MHVISHDSLLSLLRMHDDAANLDMACLTALDACLLELHCPLECFTHRFISKCSMHEVWQSSPLPVVSVGDLVLCTEGLGLAAQLGRTPLWLGLLKGLPPTYGSARLEWLDIAPSSRRRCTKLASHGTSRLSRRVILLSQ